MRSFRWLPLIEAIPIVTVVLTITVNFGQAAQSDAHIGYIYPAGARQGDTIRAIVGGQFLDGVSAVWVSGEGIRAKVIKHTKPLTQQEINELQPKVQQARQKLQEAKKQGEVTDEARTLVAFVNELGVSEEQLNALDDYYKKRADPKRQPNPQIEETVEVEITVDSAAKTGQHDLRLQTPFGLTNPIRFFIHILPECYEDTSLGHLDVTDIQESLPVTLNGQILPGDIDRFRFRAQRNQRLVAAVSARRLIPYLADAVPGWFQATLTLRDSDGREVAYADDHYFHPDPVLLCKIPRDGFYVLEIHDSIFRGREDFIYRISLGATPYVTSIFPLGTRVGDDVIVDAHGWNLPSLTGRLRAQDRAPGVHVVNVRGKGGISNEVLFAVDTLPECREQEPNDTPTSAQQITLPIIVNGQMNQVGDWDVFGFEGNAGDEVVVEVQARRLNSPLDSTVEITDASGHQLAGNDDHEDLSAGLTTHHADSYVRFRLPESGMYYVHLGDIQHKGGIDYGYRLRVGPRQPDFRLSMTPSTLNIPAGKSIPITVGVSRRDEFSEEITLALRDAPPGFELRGGPLPADQETVQLTLTAPPTSTDHPIPLRLEGRALHQGQEMIRPVIPSEDMMQAFIYHHLVPAEELLVFVTNPTSEK